MQGNRDLLKSSGGIVLGVDDSDEGLPHLTPAWSKDHLMGKLGSPGPSLQQVLMWSWMTR